MRPIMQNYCTVFTVALLLVLSASSAFAIKTQAKFAVVMDHETGAILFHKNAQTPMYPASMTKMMTAYMMFDALSSGEITHETTYPVSEKAWRKGGSKMFVKLGKEVSVHDLMRGIVIQSGNDACIVFAEGYAGSEERFAERMTLKASDIGMKDTVFKNATGWPDPEHVTTAYDLIVLARKTVLDFPEHYPVYAEKEFTYNGIRQYNRNTLLLKNIGVDGLKTGHTEAAGYGITISGAEDGRRIHAIVGGLDSEKARADEAAALYRYGMSEFANVAPGKTNHVIGALPVLYGATDEVPVTLMPDAFITLPTIDASHVRASLVYEGGIKAPIIAGQTLGMLEISSEHMSTQMVPVIATQAVEEASFIKRLVTNVTHLLR